MLNRCLLATSVAAAAIYGAAWAQTPRPTTPSPEIAWDRDDWNPHPLPDDVILPLPCNGAIALRKVVTGPPRQAGLGNYLEDRLVTLGSADDPIGYVGYVRSEYISGGFFEGTGQRYYLIGKYEVTVQQYETVMGGGSCKPIAADRAALPASNLSWFDAVEFTRRLNGWLYTERLDALPKAGNNPGFVRLPSEVEWEFAARGGLNVSDAERSNRTFVPAGAKLSDYAWFAGPESSAGELKQIGSIKPNQLGLFDMLGNVEEIIFEPFRLNRVGRPHGQHGGIVARGGSYQTPRDSIRSSARTEFAVFESTSKGEMRLTTFGMRIVVSAVAQNQMGQSASLQKEWEEARRSDMSTTGKNPFELLEGLLKQAAVPAQKAQLQAAIEQLTVEGREHKEARARSIKGLLASALAMRKSLNWSAQYLDQLHLIISEESKSSGVQAGLGRMAKNRFDEAKPHFDGYAETYSNLIQQLASETPDVVERQGEVLKTDLRGKENRKADLPTLEATLADVSRYRAGRGADRETSTILLSVVGRRDWLPR